MRHWFMVLLAAVAIYAAVDRAPPEPFAGSHESIVDINYSNNATFDGIDGITTNHDATFNIDQASAAIHGAAPATRPDQGEILPGPTTNFYQYPYVAEREEGGESAKPAQSRHPMRC